MRNILLKELKLGSTGVVFFFVIFGLMFMFPGYPILCAVLFSTQGIFKNFEYARTSNDTVFSALLPIAKKEVVKGKYIFVCFVELCAALLMLASVIIRMTLMKDYAPYRENALMNANFFALGAAFFIYGLFNMIFVGGFFKTVYKTGRPFIIYLIVALLAIGGFEALHFIPGFEALNSFGTDNLLLQLILLASGIVLWLIMTFVSYKISCKNFEKIDL